MYFVIALLFVLSVMWFSLYTDGSELLYICQYQLNLKIV